MSNNGILENEVAVDGVVEQRYWIEFYGNSRRSWVRLAGVLLQFRFARFWSFVVENT